MWRKVGGFAIASRAGCKMKRGQPIKQPEGPATARVEMRVPEPIKAKIMRNGGTDWVIRLVREAKEKEHGGSV